MQTKTYSVRKALLIPTAALLIGILSGITQNAAILNIAESVSDIFIKFLQLISMPIVFLAIISSITSIKSLQETKTMGYLTLKYTVITTLIAASVALILFSVIQPVANIPPITSEAAAKAGETSSYFSALFNLIPSNIFKAFAENNVLGVALIAFLLGFSSLSLPAQQREDMHKLFNNFFQLFLQIAKIIIYILPIGIWAFAALLIRDIQQDHHALQQLGLYVVCVLGANLIQGFVVLPLLLKYKGISPLNTAKIVSPALITAFFSKSSSATLPLTIECLTKQGKVSPRVANFVLPLCSIINMNGCAAFIFTTVLFVGMSSGMSFTAIDLILWVGIATLAAIGNASVPMGCYFLASALLTSMNAPLHLMGVILTIYVFFDMVETALNVWSDSVVASITQQDLDIEMPSITHSEPLEPALSSGQHDARPNE